MSSIMTLDSIAGDEKYLIFSLSRERYGFDIGNVQEIVKVTTITRVPRSPRYIKGVINLRGKIIPVIDLRQKFQIDPIPYDDKTCIIVVSAKRQSQSVLIGIIVDTVIEVSSFTPDEIETAPNYGAKIDASCIRALGRKADQTLTVLLNLEQVIDSPDSDV